MSYSINVTYHSPAWTPGRTEVIGTNSNIVNTSVSNLQSRGYVIDSIVAQGAGKNVTGPVSQVVPSAQYNKASTVIYKAGTPIGKELEQPVTPQPVTQQTVQLKRGESYIGGIIYPEVKSATGVLPIPIKGQPDTRPQQKAYGLAQQSIQLQLYFNKQQVQMIEAAPSSTVFTRQDGTQITREQALQEAKANETNLSTNLNNISSYQRQGYDISQPKPGEYSFILSSEKQQQMQLAAINAENAMYKKLGWMGELVVKGKTALGYATYGTEYLHALGLTGIVSYYDYVQNIASGNIEKKFEGIQGNITIKGHDIWKNLENKDYGAAGVKIATSPTMTDIVLPFAFAGGLSLAFKGVGLAAGAAVSEAAAGSSSIITKTAAVVLPPFLKTAPWVIGTTFTSMAGAQVGMTAAMEQKGVLAKGSTALLIQKLGVQFGSAGIGASMAWNSKVFNAKIANQKIITKTVGIRNPENPTEALFISKVKGKDIFSVVETRPIDVGLKEPITVSSGMMYYKSGSKGIAFKEQPIFGVSKGKYMGDVNEYLTTTSRGLFLGEKEIIISKGLSLSKTLYEGESIIKGGSLSQRKGTVELIESIGAFKGKTTKGIFGDITKIVTPKVEGKEYFGSDMGFAQHDLLLVTKNVSDMLLPGGIFAETTKIGYPLVMAPMYPQVTKIIEEDISYASSHWIGIKPVITERISIVSLISNLNKEINSVKSGIDLSALNVGISSKSLVKQDVLQANITRQLLAPIQLPDVMQGLKQQPIQIIQQRQVQTQIQRQLQNQIQAQVQIQSQVQLQQQVLQQLQLQQQETIKIIIPFGLILPGGGKATPQTGNSYHVLVKNKQYEHGKKVHPTSFSKATKQPLSKWDALALGADIVGHSAKATFKLEPSEQPPARLAKPVKPWYNIMNQFDIKPDGRTIEKIKYRINTPGEKKEITFKGIMARRKPRWQ